jgi:large subunit ribosomal protein L8e
MYDTLILVFKPKDEEAKTRKLNYLLFQEAKIERMITKYDKFNEKAQHIPSYGKGRTKNENFTSDLLKAMENKESETRVETIQEINSKHAKELNLMDYNSQRRERFHVTMSELHNKKYKRYWDSLRVGK